MGADRGPHQERATEGIMGMFGDTLVIRLDLSGGLSFREFLGRSVNFLGGACLPGSALREVVEELQPERDLSPAPVSRWCSSPQNAPETELTLPGLRLVLMGLGGGDLEDLISPFSFGNRSRLGLRGPWKGPGTTPGPVRAGDHRAMRGHFELCWKGS